jgi:hypothetical protein
MPFKLSQRACPPAIAVYFSQCLWYLDGIRTQSGTATSAPRVAAASAAACSAVRASLGVGRQQGRPGRQNFFLGVVSCEQLRGS